MIYQTKDEMLAVLGAGLRAARLSLNISQQEAAVRSGIALNAVRNIEEGRNASTFSLMALCATLRKTDWLMTLKPVTIDESAFERADARPRMRAGKARKAAERA